MGRRRVRAVARGEEPPAEGENEAGLDVGVWIACFEIQVMTVDVERRLDFDGRKERPRGRLSRCMAP